MFYIEKDNKIVLFDESKGKLVDTIKFMPQYHELEIKEVPEGYVIVDFELLTIAQAQEKQAQKEREELDRLTLTPADVERALYRAKGMDFTDLKNMITEAVPTIDMKALAIEFRARDFYRGAEAGGVRLFDTIGAILGYSSADMDYLFLNKDLPNNETTTDTEL